MKWISVKDRLPPGNLYVLVACFDLKYKMFSILIAERQGNDWLDDCSGANICLKYGKVTHWMLLPNEPEIPKEGI